jgi:FkbM family methyltransferase
MAEFNPRLIISVEPCCQNYLALMGAVRDKRLPVIPIHAAVWHVARIGGIRRASNQDGLSTLLADKWGKIYPDAGFEAPEDVACVTMHMLAAHYGKPDYVKIDVEGAELDALSGMTFKSEFLTFEFHGKFKLDTVGCFSRLVGLGYTKAVISTTDIDYSAEPNSSIHDVANEFERSCPDWGNITVA